MLATLATALIAQTAFTAPKITSISLFKNGFSFVTREIEVKDDVANVIEIPRASLGTLWFWTNSGSIESITTDRELSTKKVKVSLGTFEDLLAKNVGRNVTVSVRGPGAQTGAVSGTVVMVEGTVVVIKNESGNVVISKGDIYGLQTTDDKFMWTTEAVQETEQKFYRLRTTGKPGKIMMMSLERGATWAPAYAVDITDGKKLSVIAKATVLNDLADLTGVRARLITGFPNLTFQNILEPISAQMSVDQWLGMLSGPGMPGGGGSGARRDAMTQNAYAPAFDGNVDWSGVPTEGGEGEKLGDLFFYDVPGFTLKKEARTSKTLFRTESEFDHIYCWDIADDVVNNEFRAPGPTQAVPEEVWHALRFKNMAKQPLTTAPATVLEKGEMIGQGMLNYVPSGADAELRINKSLEVRPEQTEEELARERGAIKNPAGYPVFDLVTVKGTLEVKNMKTEAIQLVIKKDFTGEFIEGEGEPKVTKSVKGLRDANPRGRLQWMQQIEAGKSLKLTYQYKLYVRSQN